VLPQREHTTAGQIGVMAAAVRQGGCLNASASRSSFREGALTDPRLVQDVEAHCAFGEDLMLTSERSGCQTPLNHVGGPGEKPIGVRIGRCQAGSARADIVGKHRQASLERLEGTPQLRRNDARAFSPESLKPDRRNGRSIR